MSSTEQNILKTLAYFNIFQYPLSKEELLLFHAQRSTQAVIDAALNILCNKGLVFRLDEFYSMQSNNTLAERRRNGNTFAVTQMRTAHKAARILSRFPYVRGLAISGSLSKNFADESTDIDFFIITATDRLWIARTVMHLFYKLIYFTGRQCWFCMNYYVDLARLEIVEKNIYTAIEIATLLPMQGKEALDDFMFANEWIKKYYPLCETNTINAGTIKKGFLSRMFETLFNGKLGSIIDDLLMRITEKRWKKKVQRQMKNKKGLTFGMKVDKHFSKPDPTFFQDKVIEMYHDNISRLRSHPVHPHHSSCLECP